MNEWRLTIWPSRAQFRPGEPVGLNVRVEGPPGQTAQLHVALTDGAEAAGHLQTPVAPGDTELRWVPPAGDAEAWRAFGADAQLSDAHGQPLCRAGSAFDVAPHWAVAPRYGFLADFGPNLTEAEDKLRLEQMLRLHLNLVQFYDWMYTHHTYLPPQELFTDPMGRTVDFGAVRRRLQLCRSLGMAPFAYASVYGGEWDLVQDRPDWLLYDGTGAPMCLTGTPFYIQDPSPGSGWRDQLMAQYRAALEIGFAGLHCDTYGSPRRGLTHSGAEVRLDRVLPDLVAEAQALAVAADPAEGGAIFNNVGGWPLEAITRHKGAGAALYVEVWDPHPTYRDLYELVQQARRLDPARQVVLAAYMHAWHPKDGAARPEATAGDRAMALAGLKLTAAAIFASGGFQLLPGEGGGVLTEAYYPTYAPLNGPEWEGLRAYWDFQTRYGPWLADREAGDISFTHAGGPNRELRVRHGAQGESAASPEGLPGSLWLLHREGAGYRTVNLINLTQVRDPRWTGPQPETSPVEHVHVRAEVLKPPRRVWTASPDRNGGRPELLAVTSEAEPHVGLVCAFTVPRVDTWSLVVIEES